MKRLSLVVFVLVLVLVWPLGVLGEETQSTTVHGKAFKLDPQEVLEKWACLGRKFYGPQPTPDGTRVVLLFLGSFKNPDENSPVGFVNLWFAGDTGEALGVVFTENEVVYLFLKFGTTWRQVKPDPSKSC